MKHKNPKPPNKKARSTIQILKELKDLSGGSLKIFPLLVPFAMTFISSAMEVASLGLIIPLLQLAIGEDIKSEALSKITEIYTNLFGISDRLHLIILTAVLIVLAVVLKNLFEYLSKIITQDMSMDIQHHVRTKMIHQLLMYDLLYFERKRIGEIEFMLQRGNMVPQFIMALRDTIEKIVMSLAYFCLMLYISWTISLMVFLILPTGYFVILWLKKLARSSSSKEQQSLSDLSVRSYRILSSIGLIKSYGTEDQEESEFNDISGGANEKMKKLNKVIALAPHLQEPLIVVAVVLMAGLSYVMFISGFKGAIAGFMTFFVVLKRFQSTFQTVAPSIVSIIRQKMIISSLLDLFRYEPWMVIPSGKLPFKGIKKSIEFKHINFKYDPNGPLILKDINLEIKKGQTVAFVGQTGSGKTTVVSLVARNFDYDDGQILIDGVPIKDYDMTSLRHHIGYVRQQAIILNLSVKDNLIYGMKRQVTHKEILKALKDAQMLDYVNSLPQKYDTIVGEGGADLSGGQRQRISIARAIIRNPDILILDEATSSVDTETEKKIQDALLRIFKNKTVLVNAHRLSTIEKADQIVVLEHGQLVEKGTFRQLISKKGRFFHYWKLQAGLR
ncbi:MAG: ABC transporter ATP-binding protein/permease [Nanoarchaeota archaeon]|nr:ABC transporter ATP-binding protein/permease [Nanoarchaeota archaeon]